MEPIRLINNKNDFRYKCIFPFIIQIGTGGNGGYIAQMVAQMLSIFEMSAQYVLADPDIVETKNLKNQLFVERDVGNHKAEVLAKRYSAAYQMPISYYSESYVEDVDTLKSLFKNNHIDITGNGYQALYLPIIIGCVDNNFSRQVIHQFFNETSRCLYIDVGCDSAKVPSDYGVRSAENWSEEEKEEYNESGWSGQVVCGLKLDGKTILPPLGEVFPDVLEDKDDIAPSELACSDIVSLDPQRLLTNRMAAMSVATFLNELFQDGTISDHKLFFHAKEKFMKSM